uniref:Cytochrome c oxidase subunit 2 n=1 Tax=Cephalodiscus hodgsoni TaxID=560606 RepID=A0A481P7V7_9BILA|nr:cytochrome c oxidase subunit 2 [Cephalodiscus hodgsoni]
MKLGVFYVVSVFFGLVVGYRLFVLRLGYGSIWPHRFGRPGSLKALKLYEFHSYLVSLMLVVVVGVFLLVFFLWGLSGLSRRWGFLEHDRIETFWTVWPLFLLLLVVLPSLTLLYVLEESVSRVWSTVHVVGRMWYWEYGYLKGSGGYEFFESRLLKEGDVYRPRWEVDNACMMAVGKYFRFLVTSGDVIHSFSLPRLGVKVDCVPGRVNQVYMSPLFVGVYRGQCSELCGAGHSQMPIECRVLPVSSYLLWNK